MQVKQVGGKRPGAGRPPGSKNKRTLKLQKVAEDAFRAGLRTRSRSKLTSLMLFQSIYRNDNLSMDVRMAAAEKCLPYEHPKLQSVEMTGSGGVPLNPPVINVNFVRPQPGQS